MFLALHGHQIFLFTTLAFVAAVCLPAWYTSPDHRIQRNIFQICSINSSNETCYWTISSRGNNSSIGTVLPIVVAYLAIICVGISFIGLLLSSWYIQRFSGDMGSKWLLVITTSTVLLIFILSCGVWSIMLTTNLYQHDTNIRTVRLKDFGFAFWINIGASAGYIYTLLIYLIAICQSFSK